MDRAQQIEDQLSVANMASTHVVQEVFSTVDELALSLKICLELLKAM
jgi:hypothetical protein